MNVVRLLRPDISGSGFKGYNLGKALQPGIVNGEPLNPCRV